MHFAAMQPIKVGSLTLGDPNLLGRYAVSFDERSLTFRRNLLPKERLEQIT
jgi:hypothetical protein